VTRTETGSRTEIEDRIRDRTDINKPTGKGTHGSRTGQAWKSQPKVERQDSYRKGTEKKKKTGRTGTWLKDRD
jgi:hypothetical protein